MYFDLTLQISNDGGNTWINATRENFPADGITILLAYPAGTGMNTHDFVVTHMLGYAVGEKNAGEIETPKFSKTSEGLKVTLYSLPPIGIAWKAKSTNVPGSQPTGGTDSQPTGDTGIQETTDTQQDAVKAPRTGEYTDSFGFLKGIGLALACGSVVMFVVGALGERVLYRRKRTRKNSKDI